MRRVVSTYAACPSVTKLYLLKGRVEAKLRSEELGDQPRPEQTVQKRLKKSPVIDPDHPDLLSLLTGFQRLSVFIPRVAAVGYHAVIM